MATAGSQGDTEDLGLQAGDLEALDQALLGDRYFCGCSSTTEWREQHHLLLLTVPRELQ